MIKAAFPFSEISLFLADGVSVAAEIRLRMILLNILLLRGSNIIPRQLLQSPRSPPLEA